MVRKSLRSPRENSYYKSNKVGEDDDTHFSIMTSDFATKAAITSNATTTQASKDAQKEYDAFVSGLDDRQKNAIEVLDTWFQLKASCANSKSALAPTTNLTEKELGMKLGIGAASISYSDGTDKTSDVEVKAFQKKITKLEAELVEVRTELDRERSKGKKLKDASSTVLKARKKDIESLKSKLRYYKKENEGLTQKVLLYKRALEEADKDGAATSTVPAPSFDSGEETVAASNSNTQKNEVTKDEKEFNEPRLSPVRYDRNLLRKKMMKSATSPVKASIRANKEKAEENPVKSEEDAAPEEHDIIEVETPDHGNDKRDSCEEIGEEVTEDTEPSVEEDSDLTFSEMMALGLPSVTQAPKLRPKFKISSSGTFGSAPMDTTAPPFVPSLDDAKTSTEESNEEKTNAVSSEAKEEGEKVEVSEEQLTNSAPVKSKVASLADSYGSSVRAKRMSFERLAPVSSQKEPVPIPVEEDTSAALVEEAVAMDSEAVPAAETIEVADDVAEVSTPAKESASAAVASSSVGPGSAQKELEALRSMLKGRGGMANRKRFEMFEKKAE